MMPAISAAFDAIMGAADKMNAAAQEMAETAHNLWCKSEVAHRRRHRDTTPGYRIPAASAARLMFARDVLEGLKGINPPATWEAVATTRRQSLLGRGLGEMIAKSPYAGTVGIHYDPIMAIDYFDDVSINR